MFSWQLIFAVIFAAVLTAGSELVADDAYTSRPLLVDSSQRNGSPNHSRPTQKSPAPETSPSSLADRLLKLLANNKEFVVYGGIASFGILMMGLAIGSASSNPKNETDKQLELLKQEKEKAENLARLKAEFLNQVSHELRTPLAVIIGYIECITDGLYGQVEAKHQEILKVVAKQSSHLKNMIDQILIYSRLEAGKQPVRIEDLQLTKILSDMKETFDFLCKQKGLDMRWEIPKDSLSIRSDLTRVKEVISNLLQNAVKYTDHGSVTVRVVKVTTKDSIVVEVEDTGMGISEHHLASIFEPFMQAHKTSSENSRGGIGLGLSIVKKHLEQIKGTIDVESELGKGTKFRVNLPRSYDKPRSRTKRFLAMLNPRMPRERRPHSPLPLQSKSDQQKPSNTSHVMG
jgi:signal transduction histidine kinase